MPRFTSVALVATALVFIIAAVAASTVAATSATLLDSSISYDLLDWPRVRLTLETPGGEPINGAAGGPWPSTAPTGNPNPGTYLNIPDFLDTVAYFLGGASILPQILYRDDLITYDSVAQQTTIALVFGVDANVPTTTTTTARRIETTTTSTTNPNVTLPQYAGGVIARNLRQLLIMNGRSALSPYVTYKAVFGDTPTFAPTTTFIETYTPVPTFNISEVGINGTVFQESSSSVAMAVGIALGVIVVLVGIGIGYSVYHSYKTKGMRSGKGPVGNAAKYANTDV